MSDVIKVPRELLADLIGLDHDKRINAERSLYATLANAPAEPAQVQEAVKHGTKGSRKALGAMNAKLKAKIGRLERELATVKQSLTVEPVASSDDIAKDAARYRWLRCRTTTERITILSRYQYDADMDAAIDAAMAGGRE